MAERPPSRKIADDIREAILSGELTPGAVLPSERELIAKYGTTKSTAAKASAALQAEGLITTEVGRGTYVRINRRQQTSADIPDAAREILEWIAKDPALA